MRAVIQRVDGASISIEGTEPRKISAGLLVFLGVMDGDEEAQAEYLAKKICDLRIFKDDNDRLNLSLKDIKGQILIISNFTLAADCRHGRRPSFEKAAKPQRAQELYDYFVSLVRKESELSAVETGEFGAHMHINAQNDGPVNIIMDTENIAKH